MIPPKKEEWETIYPETFDPVERERAKKKMLHDREIKRRAKTLEKIKPGDLVEYRVNGDGPLVGLVLETKHEAVDNHATTQPENELIKYIKIQWSQKIPPNLSVPSNEEWWFSLNRGYWKLLNR